MPTSKRPSVVVDASFVVQLAIPGPATARVAQQVDTWQQQRRDLQAPELLRYELTNALFRAARLGRLTFAEARGALEALFELPIRLSGSPNRSLRAFQIASELGLGAAYDAIYLALAEELGAELWTADARLARVVTPARPWVRLIELS